MFPQQPAAHPETNPAPQPETDPVPPPVPVVVDTATDAAPPVDDPALPPAPPPAPLPVPQPPVVPGRRAFRILVTVAVVVTVAIAATATLGWSDVSDRRQDVSDRKADLAAITRQEEAAARALADDFTKAGLSGLLQRVKDLDKAADAAFATWRGGTARFGVLDAAMNACNVAVSTYDSAAGPFPDHMFTTLPRQIDVKNPETDCGRAFTAGI